MANLASIILEGSQAGSSMDMGNYDYSDMAIAESSYVDSAIATLFTDIMEADQAYMVADVVGAATVIRENSLGNAVDAVAVSEGVVKDGIAKLKIAFQKFIAKIKEYYKRVINWFKAMFSNGEDFVKNYGDMIKKKANKVKDFHYNGYKYTKKAGDDLVTSIVDKVKTQMTKYIDSFDLIDQAKTDDEFNTGIKNVLKTDFTDNGKPSASEDVESFIKSDLKYDDISELRTKVVEAYRDNTDKKRDIKDFEANAVDEMITFIKSSNKVINDLKNQLKNFEDSANKAITRLKKFESDDKQNGNNLVSHASYISSLITAYLNLYKVPCEVRISVYKTMSSDFLGVLKKFYNFKGNKGAFESAEIFDAEAYATLENYIILEGECKESDDDDDNDSDDDTDNKEEKATESVVASILEQAAAFTL